MKLDLLSTHTGARRRDLREAAEQLGPDIELFLILVHETGHRLAISGRRIVSTSHGSRTPLDAVSGVEPNIVAVLPREDLPAVVLDLVSTNGVCPSRDS